MLARQLRATAGEPLGSVPPIGKPPVKPPKTHRFRNFTLFLGLVGAAVYGGGAWLANDNDTVYDYFTQYVPGGTAVMDFVESRSRNVPIYPPERVQQLTERAVARARSDAAKVAEATKNTASNVLTKVQEKIPGKAANPATAKEVSSQSKDKPSSALSNITGRNFNSDLSALVKVINEYTQNVNSGRATDVHIGNVESALQGINAKISESRAAFDKEVDAKLRAQGQSLHEELKAVKGRLVDVYNKRLDTEVQAARSTVLAEANNRIHSQYVELQEASAKRVREYVDAERDGRLKNIDSLEKQVDKLEKTLVETGNAIGDNDAVVDYVTQVARLRNILGGEAQSLAPQLTAIGRALPKDPLVEAAIAAVPRVVQEHGVLSVSQLAARFALIVPEIRKASFVPPSAGLGGHLASTVFSSLTFRKHGLPEGDDVESVLARTETYLSQGKVIDAVAEVNSLKGWPKEIAKDWLYEGRKRSEVEFLTNVLAEEGYLHSVSQK